MIQKQSVRRGTFDIFEHICVSLFSIQSLRHILKIDATQSNGNNGSDEKAYHFVEESIACDSDSVCLDGVMFVKVGVGRGGEVMSVLVDGLYLEL